MTNFTLDNTTTKTKPVLLASHNPRNYLSFTIFTMEAVQSRKSQGNLSISIWRAFLQPFLKAFGRFFDGFLKANSARKPFMKWVADCTGEIYRPTFSSIPFRSCDESNLGVRHGFQKNFLRLSYDRSLCCHLLLRDRKR